MVESEGGAPSGNGDASLRLGDAEAEGSETATRGEEATPEERVEPAAQEEPAAAESREGDGGEETEAASESAAGEEDELPAAEEERERPEEAPPGPSPARLLAAIDGGFDRVLAAFEHKLAYDKAKDRMIDRLHSELQTHKTDLLAKATKPLINSLIRLHDEIGRVVEALLAEAEEKLDTDRVRRLFADFQGDIEIALEDQGVTRYETPDDRFDPRRQQALKTVPTAVPEDAGRIVDRVRPGFERGERILRKERVNVTKLEAAAEEPADATTDEEAEEQQP